MPKKDLKVQPTSESGNAAKLPVICRSTHSYRDWLKAIKEEMAALQLPIDADLAQYMATYYEMNFSTGAAISAEFKV